MVYATHSVTNRCLYANQVQTAKHRCLYLVRIASSRLLERGRRCSYNITGNKKHPGGNRKHPREPPGTENTIPGKGNTTGPKSTKTGTKNTRTTRPNFYLSTNLIAEATKWHAQLGSTREGDSMYFGRSTKRTELKPCMLLPLQPDQK